MELTSMQFLRGRIKIDGEWLSEDKFQVQFKTNVSEIIAQSWDGLSQKGANYLWLNIFIHIQLGVEVVKLIKLLNAFITDCSVLFNISVYIKITSESFYTFTVSLTKGGF